MNISTQLIERLKRKEESAFDEVYTQFFKLVKHVIYQIIPNDDISNDLTQETFLKVYEKIDTFQNNISFTAWICTIAKNIAINEKKKRDREVSLPEVEIEREDSAKTPDVICRENEVIAQIKELLGERDYNLFILKTYHKLSYEDLSNMLGETIPALTNRYHRAVKKIKKNIKL